MNQKVKRLMRSCFGKKKYRTLGYAENRAGLIGKEHGIKLRVYWCGICNGFHLTKRPTPTEANQ